MAQNDHRTRLVQIDVAERPFSPSPLNGKDVAVLFKAALNLFRLWGVNDEQAGVVLDLPRRTYARWKRGEVGRVSRDGQTRLSNLMGIHKALRTIFVDPRQGYAWIKAPNQIFGGRSALDVMLGGEITDLMRVRRYLDSERGGW